jgi:hypothetical protein
VSVGENNFSSVYPDFVGTFKDSSKLTYYNKNKNENLQQIIVSDSCDGQVQTNSEDITTAKGELREADTSMHYVNLTKDNRFTSLIEIINKLAESLIFDPGEEEKLAELYVKHSRSNLKERKEKFLHEYKSAVLESKFSNGAYEYKQLNNFYTYYKKFINASDKINQFNDFEYNLLKKDLYKFALKLFILKLKNIKADHNYKRHQHIELFAKKNLDFNDKDIQNALSLTNPKLDVYKVISKVNNEALKREIESLDHHINKQYSNLFQEMNSINKRLNTNFSKISKDQKNTFKAGTNALISSSKNFAVIKKSELDLTLVKLGIDASKINQRLRNSFGRILTMKRLKNLYLDFVKQRKNYNQLQNPDPEALNNLRKNISALNISLRSLTDLKDKDAAEKYFKFNFKAALDFTKIFVDFNKEFLYYSPSEQSILTEDATYSIDLTNEDPIYNEKFRREANIEALELSEDLAPTIKLLQNQLKKADIEIPSELLIEKKPSSLSDEEIIRYDAEILKLYSEHVIKNNRNELINIVDDKHLDSFSVLTEIIFEEIINNPTDKKSVILDYTKSALKDNQGLSLRKKLLNFINDNPYFKKLHNKNFINFLKGEYENKLVQEIITYAEKNYKLKATKTASLIELKESKNSKLIKNELLNTFSANKSMKIT